MIADSLDVQLDFMCYKQLIPAGEKVREWIIKHVRPINKGLMLKPAGELSRIFQ